MGRYLLYTCVMGVMYISTHIVGVYMLICWCVHVFWDGGSCGYLGGMATLGATLRRLSYTKPRLTTFFKYHIYILNMLIKT